MRGFGRWPGLVADENTIERAAVATTWLFR